MQRLWQEFAPDTDRVIQEYAAAETTGVAPRGSNRQNIPPVEYARRLLADGLAKGWLPASHERRLVIRREPIIQRAHEPSATGMIPAVTPRSIQGWEGWATDTARALGVPSESLEYLLRIRNWRAIWRPDRVRVLLVAESHVVEQPGDIHCYVRLPESVKSPVLVPDGFCRLVYCLGYGESAICRPNQPSSNGGTWQFWDIFGSIATCYEPSLEPQMPRRGNSDLHYRLWWKVTVLETLRRAGVWLEDASVIGLYSAGGDRLAHGSAYTRIVRASFESFVWPEVAKDQPEQVWIIGRGVGGALRGLPMIQESHIISQPQDRNAERRTRDIARLLHSLPDRKEAT
jgi:hypothetical protein